MIKYKKNNIIKTLFLFLFIGTLMGVVFAEGPSTEPCWVKGTVTAGTGITTVNGLTVGAYDGSTLLMEGTIASGSYSLNSVGSTTGTTITLKVYGAPFDTFTFAGFCDTNGDPWVVQDFTISKQANGIACSDNAICTSGYCNGTICATPSGGGSNNNGGSGGTSTVHDTNTEDDTNTTGTGTGTDTNTGTNLPPVIPSLITGTEREEILSQADISGLFGAGTLESNLTLNSLYSETNVLTSDEIDTMITNLSRENQNLINGLIASHANENVQVTTQLQSYVITDTLTGISQIVSKITITITALDDLGQVTYIEEIPKTIAANIAELTFNIPPTQILNADPVVLFTFNNLAGGEAREITYMVNKNIQTLQDNNYFAAGTLVVTAPGTTPPYTDTTSSKKSNVWLYVVVILLVILLVAGSILYLNKKKQPKGL